MFDNRIKFLFLRKRLSTSDGQQWASGSRLPTFGFQQQASDFCGQQQVTGARQSAMRPAIDNGCSPVGDGHLMSHGRRGSTCGDKSEQWEDYLFLILVLEIKKLKNFDFDFFSKFIFGIEIIPEIEKWNCVSKQIVVPNLFQE